MAHDIHGTFLGDDLYFFRAAGAVKIGRSAKVKLRLNDIRCSCPVPVMMWATLDARGFEESVWHTLFADKRQNGEWFKWCKEISRAIRLAQNGHDWWKANSALPDTDRDEEVRRTLTYLSETCRSARQLLPGRTRMTENACSVPNGSWNIG